MKLESITISKSKKRKYIIMLQEITYPLVRCQKEEKRFSFAKKKNDDPLGFRYKQHKTVKLNPEKKTFRKR